MINNIKQIKFYIPSYSHPTPTIPMSPSLLQLEITPKFLAFLFGVIFGFYFGVFFRIPKLRRISSVLISEFFFGVFLSFFLTRGFPKADYLLLFPFDFSPTTFHQTEKHFGLISCYSVTLFVIFTSVFSVKNIIQALII